MLYSAKLSFQRPNYHQRENFIADAQLHLLVEATSADEAVDKVVAQVTKLHDQNDEVLGDVHELYLESLLEIVDSKALEEGLVLEASCEDCDEDGERYNFSTIIAESSQVQAYLLGEEGEELEPLIRF